MLPNYDQDFLPNNSSDNALPFVTGFTTGWIAQKSKLKEKIQDFWTEKSSKIGKDVSQLIKQVQTNTAGSEQIIDKTASAVPEAIKATVDPIKNTSEGVHIVATIVKSIDDGTKFASISSRFNKISILQNKVASEGAFSKVQTHDTSPVFVGIAGIVGTIVLRRFIFWFIRNLFQETVNFVFLENIFSDFDSDFLSLETNSNEL